MSFRWRWCSDRPNSQRIHLLFLLQMVLNCLEHAQILLCHQLGVKVFSQAPQFLLDFLSVNWLQLVISNLGVQLACRSETSADDLNLATSLFGSTLRCNSVQISWLLELKCEPGAIVINAVGGDLNLTHAMAVHLGGRADNMVG